MRNGQISFLWVIFELIKVFFLFSGIFDKKVRNSQVLIERKAMMMFFKKENKSNEVSRTKKTRTECSAVHNQTCTEHNHAPKVHDCVIKNSAVRSCT